MLARIWLDENSSLFELVYFEDCENVDDLSEWIADWASYHGLAYDALEWEPMYEAVPNRTVEIF